MPPRIATLTVNPAVDIACRAPAVRPTHKIRTVVERFDPGGGGINVARVLHALGEDVRALIVTGGVTGRLIEELLDAAQIRFRAIPIDGPTRISMNAREEESGLEYRFVPEGPVVTAAELGRLRDAVLATEADWLVASGSLPPGVPPGFYGELAEAAGRRGQRFVLDASGPALRDALGRGIALLKLSASELEYVVGRPLPDAASRDAAIGSLLRAGAAGAIAVSLGRDGAVLATAERVVQASALTVPVRSTVGAGDAFLAGLVSGLAGARDLSEALALATACGAAAVATPGTAQVSRAAVEALLAPHRSEATDARRVAAIGAGSD